MQTNEPKSQFLFKQSIQSVSSPFVQVLFMINMIIRKHFGLEKKNGILIKQSYCCQFRNDDTIMTPWKDIFLPAAQEKIIHFSLSHERTLHELVESDKHEKSEV